MDSMILVEAIAALAPTAFAPDHFSINYASMKLKDMQEGLSQSLRWLRSRSDWAGALPIADSKGIEAASHFLQHAADYVHLSDMHRLYGQGLASIRVQEDLSTVTFDVSPIAGGTHPATSTVESTLLQAGFQSSQDRSEGKELFRRAEVLEFDEIDGRVRMRNPLDFVNQVNATIAKRLITTDFRVLPENADLGICTLSELDRFWISLWQWSFATQYAYVKRARQGTPQEKIFPTQVCDRKQFVDVMAAASDIERKVVERIVDALTFGMNQKSPDLWLQPLLVHGSNVAWGARTVLTGRYRRNTLRLLARGNYSNQIASLVGSFETGMMDRLKKRFEKSGYVVFCGRPIAHASDRGEIDVLAWNATTPGELLMLECKGALPPDEVNEVKELTGYANAAQEQLCRCERILRAMSTDEKSRQFPGIAWSNVKSVHPVVVFFEGSPDHSYDHTKVPAIDLRAIMSGMRSRDFKSPSRFHAASVAAPWMANIKVGRTEHRDIVIGPITYRVPFAEIDQT
jgi:hypothetical protein